MLGIIQYAFSEIFALAEPVIRFSECESGRECSTEYLGETKIII